MAEIPCRQIDTVMHETRVFPPSGEFAALRIGSPPSPRTNNFGTKPPPIRPPFWGKLAGFELHWFPPVYESVLDWQEPFAHWFVGGQTNVSFNCLEPIHLGTPRRKQGRHLGRRTGRLAHLHLSAELHREVCKFANVLKNLGVETRRRCFYLHADDAGACHRHARLCGSAR